MSNKEVMANLLTVVCLIVETSTDIVKPKVSLEAYLSITKPLIIVISIVSVISPSLYCSLFFSSMLIYNCRSHESIGQR